MPKITKTNRNHFLKLYFVDNLSRVEILEKLANREILKKAGYKTLREQDVWLKNIICFERKKGTHIVFKEARVGARIIEEKKIIKQKKFLAFQRRVAKEEEEEANARQEHEKQLDIAKARLLASEEVNLFEGFSEEKILKNIDNLLEGKQLNKTEKSIADIYKTLISNYSTKIYEVHAKYIDTQNLLGEKYNPNYSEEDTLYIKNLTQKTKEVYAIYKISEDVSNEDLNRVEKINQIYVNFLKGKAYKSQHERLEYEMQEIKNKKVKEIGQVQEGDEDIEKLEKAIGKTFNVD